MSSSSTDGRRDPFAPVADPPSAAGVPAHLVDHLHAPDKRVFALKAELDAARRAARAAEELRLEKNSTGIVRTTIFVVFGRA